MIGRGTTPSLTFTFDTITVGDIVMAYLTIQQFRRNIIEKTLQDAEISFEDNCLTWDLSQAETLLLSNKEDIRVQIRYKLIDDTAFISEIYEIKPYGILKDGVI